jgi:hypothetical protein
MRPAWAFISATNPSSLPPTASASVIAASLPDWMTMPRIRSDTATGLPASTNMREPIAFTAARTA